VKGDRSLKQGQRLLIGTDAETRRRIARLCGEEEMSAAGYDPWLSEAPAHFIPCVSEAVYHRRYREADKVQDDGTEIDWPIPYWWTDVGATALLIHQAAIAEGLAAGFLGLEDYSELKGYLDIPDEQMPIGIVTVGYAALDRRSKSLKRGWVAKDDFAHWQKW
jgi:nitroreductase